MSIMMVLIECLGKILGLVVSVIIGSVIGLGISRLVIIPLVDVLWD